VKGGFEDKKKVVALSGLMLVAVYFLYSNVLSSGGGSSTPSTPAAAPAANATAGDAMPLPPAPSAQASTVRPAAGSRSRNDEFHPVLRPRNRQGESTIDPNTIDPTIHTDLLAKVQSVKIEGGQRNLFQFGAAAPVELPKKEEPIVKVARVYDYPRPLPPPVPKVDPPPPPPTPPSFKYYGLATKRIDNKRTAFFLDGDDIILATEGMTVKNRWKVVRINPDSVMLEDTQNQRQQALALSEEAGGNVGNS